VNDQPRLTRAEVPDRRPAVFAIVEPMRPMTVGQAFYQATVHSVVEEEREGLRPGEVRLGPHAAVGEMPYEWIADGTRWACKPQSFRSVDECLLDAAHYYGKDLWADADDYVEIWLEKARPGRSRGAGHGQVRHAANGR
jgi:hypothetical protein